MREKSTGYNYSCPYNRVKQHKCHVRGQIAFKLADHSSRSYFVSSVPVCTPAYEVDYQSLAMNRNRLNLRLVRVGTTLSCFICFDI